MNMRSQLLSTVEGDTRVAERLTQRGIALAKDGFHQEAVSEFDMAIRWRPHHWLTWYHRGEALATLNRYVEALASFEQALELEPDSYQTWTFRAVMLIYLERYEEALESCDRAIGIYPADQEAWIFRGGHCNDWVDSSWRMPVMSMLCHLSGHKSLRT
ncbi:tetratricopeptide repeat protein [Leptodesmis sp.]|uniref:tetratricopeptide repeat protein n=1 Tax=Leptodesmis sp. TaxID=3100501 RepID=UPI004053545B